MNLTMPLIHDTQLLRRLATLANCSVALIPLTPTSVLTLSSVEPTIQVADVLLETADVGNGILHSANLGCPCR